MRQKYVEQWGQQEKESNKERERRGEGWRVNIPVGATGLGSRFKGAISGT